MVPSVSNKRMDRERERERGKKNRKRKEGEGEGQGQGGRGHTTYRYVCIYIYVYTCIPSVVILIVFYCCQICMHLDPWIQILMILYKT